MKFLDQAKIYVRSGDGGNSWALVTLTAFRVLAFDPFTPGTTDPDDVESALEASSDVLATATMRGRSDPAGPSCN